MGSHIAEIGYRIDRWRSHRRERAWQAENRRKFGVGNISLADGGKFKPHNTHKDGLQVDVRPLRKDGKHVPVAYFKSGYDKEAATRLIGLFQSPPFVKAVLFNDSDIPGVKHLDHHDDHFHVAL